MQSKEPSVVIEVKIISRIGDSVIIEYTDGSMPIRLVVAHSSINNGTLSNKEIEEAAPYGLPMTEDLGKVKLAYNPLRLQKALRDRGVWTLHDLESKPTLVQAALMESLQFDVSKLIQLASEFEHGE